jgi:3-oxoacyl-[acyl-carrier protein] reductase
MRTRVAIITGAGQGIGRAIAEDLAGRGYAVVVAEREPDRAREVAAAIEAAGGLALPAVVDVTDATAVQAMVDTVKARYGRIDVLVSSARWTGLRPTPVAQITDEDWARALNVNVTGAFHCVRAVTPTMIAQDSGRIIVLSSATVTLPPARPYVHYITTKAALIGMVRALAKELGPNHITVNAVLPGAVETGVERPHLTVEQRRARAAESQSIPELIESGDITGAVAFLASDESRFITGQSITVDGGRSFL